MYIALILDYYNARADVVASLTNMFNISIQRGTFPKEWKRARVTRVYKGKGNKDDSNNYRPILVISFVAKMLEKCVRKQLPKYLEYYDFITPDQSAYLKHHSTQTVIHIFVCGWLGSINDGLINCICFIDFTKCFNTINPGILLFKLEKYGIRGQTHKWFTFYLTDISQNTIVNGIISALHDVKIGIPQGCVLVPILFLLFVNDDLPMFICIQCNHFRR